MATASKNIAFSWGYYSLIHNTNIGYDPTDRLISGCTGIFLLSLLTHPLDTIKTHVQSDLKIDYSISKLMRGVIPRATLTTLNVIVYYMVYTGVSDIMNHICRTINY